MSSWPLRGHTFRKDFILQGIDKENINFWKEGLTAEKDTIEVEKRNLFIALIKSLDKKSNEIMR